MYSFAPGLPPWIDEVRHDAVERQAVVVAGLGEAREAQHRRRRLRREQRELERADAADREPRARRRQAPQVVGVQIAACLVHRSRAAERGASLRAPFADRAERRQRLLRSRRARRASCRGLRRPAAASAAFSAGTAASRCGVSVRARAPRRAGPDSRCASAARRRSASASWPASFCEALDRRFAHVVVVVSAPASRAPRDRVSVAAARAAYIRSCQIREPRTAAGRAPRRARAPPTRARRARAPRDASRAPTRRRTDR